MRRVYRQHLAARWAFLFLTLAAVVLIAQPASAKDPQNSQSEQDCCDFWQPGWLQWRMWQKRGDTGEVDARRRRHHKFMHDGLPEAYRETKSTIEPSTTNVAAGRALYAQHCTECHGKTGMGDGEAVKGLSPSPALLVYLIKHPIAVDAYLLWSIAEGGKSFGSDMPAFKEKLSRDEIWNIVLYMRKGFPKPSVEN